MARKPAGATRRPGESLFDRLWLRCACNGGSISLKSALERDFSRSSGHACPGSASRVLPSRTSVRALRCSCVEGMLGRQDGATGTRHASAHDSRNTAGIAPRPCNAILEIASCRRSGITGAQIREGAATPVGLAGRFAWSTRRVGRQLERTVITADPIDRIFGYALARRGHTGAAYPRNATGIRIARRYAVFQPAGGRRFLGAGKLKAPGATSRVTFAACSADRRIAVAHGEAHVIASATVIAVLRVRRPAQKRQDKRQHGGTVHLSRHEPGGFPTLAPRHVIAPVGKCADAA